MRRVSSRRRSTGSSPRPTTPPASRLSQLTLTLDLDTDIDFTEFVEINASFQHNSFRDLRHRAHVSVRQCLQARALRSTRLLTTTIRITTTFPLRGPHRFGSARHLGEDPNGTWTIRITDRFRFGTGNHRVVGHNCLWTLVRRSRQRRPCLRRGRDDLPLSRREHTGRRPRRRLPSPRPTYDELTYTLGGPDMALFNIDSTGQISVGPGTSLDYEVRTGYVVAVTCLRPIRRDRHDHRQHRRDRRLPWRAGRPLRRRPQRKDNPRRGHTGDPGLPRRPDHQERRTGDHQPIHLRLIPSPLNTLMSQTTYLPPAKIV